MAVILPLLMATSVANVSVAVTTRPFMMTVSKLICRLVEIAKQAFYAKLRHLGRDLRDAEKNLR